MGLQIVAYPVYAFCSFDAGPEAKQGTIIRCHTASPRLISFTWEVLRCLDDAATFCSNPASQSAPLHIWHMRSH